MTVYVSKKTSQYDILTQLDQKFFNFKKSEILCSIFLIKPQNQKTVVYAAMFQLKRVMNEQKS